MSLRELKGFAQGAQAQVFILRYFIADFIARKISSFQGLGSHAWHIVGVQCRLTE